MHIGLCGYPGGGKSTVLTACAPKAQTRKGVAYGNIKVPDARIDKLAEIFSPKKNVYAEITLVDVGGGGRSDTGVFPPEVVQNMRNADVLIHVVRVFDNPMVAAEADHARDVANFNDEILLLDTEVIERRHKRFSKENRKGAEMSATAKALEHLESGEPLRTLDMPEMEWESLNDVQLLSVTPLITLYNLSEEAWADEANAELKQMRETGKNALSMGVCASMEAEIAELDPEEQAEFLAELGMTEPARNEMIRAAYRLLDLISFLTAGPDECRAWPIRRGTVARKAAGKVHSDIERGFIRAEIYQLAEMLEYGSESALKSAGKMRLEGKEYVVQDGDVVNYRFNV